MPAIRKGDAMIRDMPHDPLRPRRVIDPNLPREQRAILTLRAALRELLNQGVSGNFATIASRAIRETDGIVDV